MRLITIILSLFLLMNSTNAHCKNHNPTPDTLKTAVKKHHKKYRQWPKFGHSAPPDKLYYCDCVFTKKFTAVQRLKKYPFSKATKILAVSYDGSGDRNIEITIDGDTLDAMTHKNYRDFKSHGLQFKKGTLDTSNLFEVKQLTAKQINRLTDIMYNTDNRIPNDYLDPGRKCFNPRNALIFYDKSGKVFDYLEICFECDMMESKSNRIHFHSECTQRFDLVKKFLINVGFKYGTLTTKNPDDHAE